MKQHSYAATRRRHYFILGLWEAVDTRGVAADVGLASIGEVSAEPRLWLPVITRTGL